MIRRAVTTGAIVLLAALAAACAPGVHGAQPLPAIPDSGELLDAQRVAQLPPERRDAWLQYLARSDRLRQADRAAIDAELEALGLARWTPAPGGRALVVDRTMTPDWFSGPEARRIADNILSFQTPAGGWSKSVDLRLRPRAAGESYAAERNWHYIGTFDNDATTEQLRFLAGAYRGHRDERYRDAFERGLEYVYRAQFPNGCWPQVYPLQGSYHDAVTFNDDALVQVLQLLRDVVDLEFLSDAERRRATASLQAGIDCVLASQVEVDGVKKVWGAQHDPLTLLPVAARAYEHASLSGGESVDVLEFLMEIEAPDARIVEAVHAAAAWFRRTAIHGYDYDISAGLVAREGAGPVWARFYEIGTNRPIFSNRDAVIRYSWHELDDERRLGYAWYRDSATRALRTYDRWVDRRDVSPR